MAPELEYFIECARRREFVWGDFDCTLFPADWIALKRGFDPAAEWRGRYRTAQGCHAMLARAGGLLRVVDAALAAHGIEPAYTPQPGDVAIVRAPVRSKDGKAVFRNVGSIRQGKFWTVKTEAGISGHAFEVVKAWRI